MPALIPWLLAVALLPMPSPESGGPRRIDVNCRLAHALEGAIVRAKNMGGQVDIVVHGMCEGNFIIDSDGITLRGADNASGLAAPEGAFLPVIEVIEARASLRGLLVRGGPAGLVVRGWNADVFVHAIDVHGQTDVGVFAQRGAQLTVLDSTVHDSEVGILADSSAQINLQRVTVRDERIGVAVSQHSFAAVNDSTISNNREAGLAVYSRSDVNVFGGAFRDNGQVHIGAGEWSEVNLLSGVTIGSEGDATPYALSVIRGAAIASFSTPAIQGHVSALIGGSVRLGNTALAGDLIIQQFANAYVRNAAIAGVVACFDGAEAICSSTTTLGVFGCPSPTCGPPATADGSRAAPHPAAPTIELPRFNRLRRDRQAATSTSPEPEAMTPRLLP